MLCFGHRQWFNKYSIKLLNLGTVWWTIVWKADHNPRRLPSKTKECVQQFAAVQPDQGNENKRRGISANLRLTLWLKRQSFFALGVRMRPKVWRSEVQTPSPCEFTAYKCSSVPPQTARGVDFGKQSTALRIFYSWAPQKANYSGRIKNYVKCRPSEPKETNPQIRERLNGPFAWNILLYVFVNDDSF